MISATIFNIQQFSLNDGPGIRTVVFLKGCPMRCGWCSNPESQIRTPQFEWDPKSCSGCSACNALPASPGFVKTDRSRAVDVHALRYDDPAALEAVRECKGLSLVGRARDLDEVVDQCMKDLPFYRQSGGGVTLSGGEPLVWGHFCVALLTALQDRGIDTNIETTGHVPESVFRSALDHLDHVFIDMKHWDEQAHKEGTGVGLSLIERNTSYALHSGKDVLVRTPVIPDYNDKLDDARQMARRLLRLGADRVQLLPFHNFGESKYDLLQRDDYKYRNVPNTHQEDLEDYRQVYEQEGVHAFF